MVDKDKGQEINKIIHKEVIIIALNIIQHNRIHNKAIIDGNPNRINININNIQSEICLLNSNSLYL